VSWGGKRMSAGLSDGVPQMVSLRSPSPAEPAPARQPGRDLLLGRGPGKTLLVASQGGHLVELDLISQRMGITGERVWVTFDTPQGQALLAGREVHYAPFAGTRDLLGTARATIWAREFLRSGNFDVVVSTGASIALAFLPLASRAGADCYYIESATRTEGPSLTGRLLVPFRSIRLHTQHSRWASQRWTYQVSIFDGFRPVPVPTGQARPPRRIVVSLGMHDGFGFRRLLERLVEIIPPDADVLWQVGSTDTAGLGIEGRRSLPPQELSDAMASSDVVITHAGIGSAISALKVGKRPVFVPRRKRFREHVDDHQASIAGELASRRLAVSAEADELRWDDVVEAASWRVEQDLRRDSRAAP
jgi:UDP-N-acetylglucosamine--N-acetylmuramyl-(pentapeptide) pyrophosphoryl-undecaprenol N-acetylglucosamine transferase